MKIIFALTLAIVPLITILPLARAQSADWNLTVNVNGVEFGKTDVTISIKGPFGYEDSSTVATGPSVQTSFSIPGNAVPAGYSYQLCGHSNGIVESLLAKCQYFRHGSGDESVTFNLR
jgi:hypothetical protein